MDLKFLQHILKETLDKSHLSKKVRYQNIGFSSKSLADLDDVTQTLRVLLPDYEVWKSPGKHDVPAMAISRKKLQDKILASTHQGIIIHQPEQWLNHWSLVDKQAFWSALGMWHGRTKVVLSFAESDEFQQINNAYFKSQSLDGVAINFWRPARAE